METYGQVIFLIVLIILSGFFSSSETALTGFKMTKLNKIEKKDKKAANLLRLWLKKPNEFLTGILIGNNVVNILASSIATTLAIHFIGNNSNAIILVTLIMTISILIFGEITPKIVAKSYSEEISRYVIRVIYFLSILLYPITIILIFISKFISRLFGIEITKKSMLITEEDIKSFVNVGEEEGILEEEEKEMIHSIFEFGDTTVKEVMIPRTTMFTIEASKPLEEVWDEIIEKGYSRIPVYEEKVDNILGMIYIKDLFTVMKDGKLNEPAKNFVRQAYFIPESKPLGELLEEFKKEHIHIAIVVDEYGGTAGLVTIEDLIEEIVGDITDEYDEEEEEEIKKISDNKYIVDAVIAIEELNKELEIKLPESEDYDTLGGFIYFELGRMPLENDKVLADNLEIKVLKVEKRRIDRVLLQKLEGCTKQED